MLKMYGMFAASGLLALTMIGPVAVAADNAPSEQPSTTTTDKDPSDNGKTSDRTPGDPSPDRTPNAVHLARLGPNAGQTTRGNIRPDTGEQKSEIS